MYAIYANNRQQLLTTAAVNELLHKNINVLTSASLFEVRVTDSVEIPPLCRKAVHALDVLQRQRPSSRKLNPDQRKALLGLEELIEWELVTLEDTGRIVPRYVEVPKRDSRYWLHQRRYVPVLRRGEGAMQIFVERAMYLEYLDRKNDKMNEWRTEVSWWWEENRWILVRLLLAYWLLVCLLLVCLLLVGLLFVGLPKH